MPIYVIAFNKTIYKFSNECYPRKLLSPGQNKFIFKPKIMCCTDRYSAGSMPHEFVIDLA